MSSLKSIVFLWSFMLIVAVQVSHKTAQTSLEWKAGQRQDNVRNSRVCDLKHGWNKYWEKCWNAWKDAYCMHLTGASCMHPNRNVGFYFGLVGTIVSCWKPYLFLQAVRIFQVKRWLHSSPLGWHYLGMSNPVLGKSVIGLGNQWLRIEPKKAMDQKSWLKHKKEIITIIK